MTDKQKGINQSEKVERIAIGEIDIETGQIRKDMNEEDLKELKDSIDTLGLLQPIVVMLQEGRKSRDKRYRLLIGLRRVKAHQLLNRDKISAIVLGEQDEEKALALSLAENLYRKQPRHKDMAEAVTKLYKLYNKDINKVTKATGIRKDTVRNYINIKEYGSEKILNLVNEGKVSLRDARIALEVAKWKTEKAEKILDLIIKEGMARTTKKRFTEIIQQNPAVRLQEALEEAKEPYIEHRIYIDLAGPIREAVTRAMKEWEMNADEIATMALQEWLEGQRYID